MKKVIRVLISMAILVCMTACDDASSLVVTSQSPVCEPTQSPNSEPPQDIYASQQLHRWNDEISLPFPAPNAQRYEIGEFGDCYCYGMTETDLDGYLEALKENGWEALNPPIHAFYSNVLIKDNMVISISDHIYNMETVENHIYIAFTNGYFQTKPNDRLNKSQAEPMIQEYIDSITSENSYAKGKRIVHLVELYIPDSFEKMNLQAFRAFDEQRSIGTYLVCNGCVWSAFMLGETMVADIDQDGAYELLSMCGFGSGNYVIRLVAYKFEQPPHDNLHTEGERSYPPYYDQFTEFLYPAYSNGYNPSGYAQLMLVKVSDTQVQLYAADRVKGELIPTTNYGLLKVDGTRLYTDAQGSPFQRQVAK